MSRISFLADLIDPLARHGHQCLTVAWMGQHLGLEPAHLASWGRRRIFGSSSHDMTHR